MYNQLNLLGEEQGTPLFSQPPAAEERNVFALAALAYDSGAAEFAQSNPEYAALCRSRAAAARQRAAAMKAKG